MSVFIQHYENHIILRLRAEEDDSVAHLEMEIHPGDSFMSMDYEDLRALGEGEIEIGESEGGDQR